MYGFSWCLCCRIAPPQLPMLWWEVRYRPENRPRLPIRLEMEMTVRDLIEYLEGCPPDLQVAVEIPSCGEDGGFADAGKVLIACVDPYGFRWSRDSSYWNECRPKVVIRSR